MMGCDREWSMDYNYISENYGERTTTTATTVQ